MGEVSGAERGNTAGEPLGPLLLKEWLEGIYLRDRKLLLYHHIFGPSVLEKTYVNISPLLRGSSQPWSWVQSQRESPFLINIC